MLDNDSTPTSIMCLYQNFMAHCHHCSILAYLQYFKVYTNLNTLTMSITFQSHHLNIADETLDPSEVNGKTSTDLRGSQIPSFIAAFIHFCQPNDKLLINAQDIT